MVFCKWIKHPPLFPLSTGGPALLPVKDIGSQLPFVLSSGSPPFFPGRAFEYFGLYAHGMGLTAIPVGKCPSGWQTKNNPASVFCGGRLFFLRFLSKKIISTTDLLFIFCSFFPESLRFLHISPPFRFVSVHFKEI